MLKAFQIVHQLSNNFLKIQMEFLLAILLVCLAFDGTMYTGQIILVCNKEALSRFPYTHAAVLPSQM